MSLIRIKIIVSGVFLFLGLGLSGASLLAALAQADELEPLDVIGPADSFNLIVDLGSQGDGSITYSYEFSD